MLYLMRYIGEGLAIGKYLTVVVQSVGKDAFGNNTCKLLISVPPPPLIVARKEPGPPSRSLGSVAALDAGQPPAPCIQPQLFRRHAGEALLVGDDVEVLVSEIRSNGARVGVLAPASVRIEKIGRTERLEAADLAAAR